MDPPVKPHNPYGTTATATAVPMQPGGGYPQMPVAGGSPMHAHGIPMAIPVGYAQPTYAQQPGGMPPGGMAAPPAMLVSPGGGFAGPYSGSAVMTNAIIYQPPEISPAVWAPETEVVVNRYRSRLQCIATAMVIVGVVGIIPTATWVTCFLAAMGGFIALSSFKDQAQLARIAGGFPSRCASPIHSYNLAIAVVVLAPLNFLFCSLQTAARGNGSFSGGPNSTGGSRFDSVTYILGIPWSIVLLGLGGAFIANYNKLAAAVRSVHLGNTCCCGPARDVSWIGMAALEVQRGRMPPTAGNLIILAPAGSMVPAAHGITGPAGGGGGGGIQMVAVSPAGHGGATMQQQPVPAGAYFVGPGTGGAAFPDGPPPAHVMQQATAQHPGSFQPPRAL